MLNWYAVQTWPSEEAHVDVKLKRLGFETFFPWQGHRWELSETSHIIKELVRRAYFTSYLFVRTGIDGLGQIASVTKVTAIVPAAGGEPAVIPEDVMEELFIKLGQSGEIKRREGKPAQFGGRRGDPFRFGENSSFFGFYATIARVLDNGRLIAKLQHTLFGVEGREIEVPITDVGDLLREEQQLEQAHGSPY